MMGTGGLGRGSHALSGRALGGYEHRRRANVLGRGPSYRPSQRRPLTVSASSSSQTNEKPRMRTASLRASGASNRSCLVEATRDVPQGGLVEVGAAQDGLERAAAPVVGKLGAAHVERCRIGRHAADIGDEGELGGERHDT
jgi:hypothetical protein